MIRATLWILAAVCAWSGGARAGGLAGISHRDKFYALAARGDDLFAVGYPGLLAHSPDRGQSWTLMDPDTDDVLYAIALNQAGQGIIVGRAGLVLTSADGGRSWKKSDSGVTSHLFDVALSEQGQAWAVGHLGVILHSADAGASWQAQSYDATLPAPTDAQGADAFSNALSAAEQENEDAVEEARLNAVAFADEQQGWIVGEFGLILHTTDGGQTWKRQRGASGKLLFGLYVYDAGHLVAFGSEGTCMRSRDGGLTWQAIGLDTEAHILAGAPAGDKLLLSGLDGLVIRVDPVTGAAEHLPTGRYVWLNAILFLDAQTGFLAGGRGHLLKTTDGGKTWQRLAGR
jgi:photosystem II stability/assembly factor-like uncharacterized protein